MKQSQILNFRIETLELNGVRGFRVIEEKLLNPIELYGAIWTVGSYFKVTRMYRKPVRNHIFQPLKTYWKLASGGKREREIGQREDR